MVQATFMATRGKEQSRRLTASRGTVVDLVVIIDGTPVIPRAAGTTTASVGFGGAFATSNGRAGRASAILSGTTTFVV